MYESFRVQNFRGFEDLELNDLARVNLIAGKNNAGKTSFLEALFIFMNPYNPELILRMNARRGLRRMKIGRTNDFKPFSSIFNNFESFKNIKLQGIHSEDGEYHFSLRRMADNEISNTIIEDFDESIFQEEAVSTISGTIAFEIKNVISEETKVVRIRVRKDEVLFETDQLSTRHATHSFGSNTRESFENLAEWYSNLITEDGNIFLQDTLRKVDNRLESLQLLYQAGEPIIFGNIGTGQLIPIVLMGDGMFKMLQYILAITNSKDGILLIDEIENGLHHSVQEDVWRAIAEAAERFNVQVFATTHSREMAMAAHRAFQSRDEYDFRYHRLDRNKKTGQIYPTTYDRLTMNDAMEMGAEVR